MKIKQSWFEMIYGRVSLSKKKKHESLVPFWAKHNILFKITLNKDCQDLKVNSRCVFKAHIEGINQGMKWLWELQSDEKKNGRKRKKDKR